MNSDVEVHFALGKFERAILDSIIDHAQNDSRKSDPMLDRSDDSFNVRAAIENGPVSELFSPEELNEVSPFINLTLFLFERAGLIEQSGQRHGWNWRESNYRLTERTQEVTTARRELASLAAIAGRVHA